MILGFAHLAINAGDLDQAEGEWLARGYSRKAAHDRVANHPSKSAFTSHFQPEHSLLLLCGSGLWGIELTWHGPVSGDNRQLTWDPEAIRVALPDPAPFRDLLTAGLGFRSASDAEFFLDGRVPGWSCRLKLGTGDTQPVRLDSSGATSLAFYCNRIDEDASRLLELGASEFSGVFDLALGERSMRIALMRLPGGPLVELISPRIRNR